MLDSGTTFTYLPSDAFARFREAVTRFALAHGLHVTKGPDPKARAPAHTVVAAGVWNQGLPVTVCVLSRVLRQAALLVQCSMSLKRRPCSHTRCGSLGGV